MNENVIFVRELRGNGFSGDEVARIMAERHPELAAEAISAIRWKWTFDWR